MKETLQHLDKQIEHYTKAIKCLMEDYLTETNDSAKQAIQQTRMGYQVTLYELETIKKLMVS